MRSVLARRWRSRDRWTESRSATGAGLADLRKGIVAVGGRLAAMVPTSPEAATGQVAHPIDRAASRRESLG